MRRIYIAGSYSADNVIQILNNIREGVKKSAEVLKNGDAPFSPWLDWMFQLFEGELTVEDYYRYSIAWLEVSEEVWVMPNSENSKGTQKEIARAKELNIPVKYLPGGNNGRNQEHRTGVDQEVWDESDTRL